MPYHLVYYDAPRDPTLPVLPELPATAHSDWLHGKFRAYDFTTHTSYTHCQKIEVDEASGCGGWIPKQAYEARVNTLDGRRLCGRRGTEYYCPRCGRQLHFEGMMS